MSKQVLTNPVPTPLNPISFFSRKIKSSFGRLFKKRKDKTNKIPTSAADSMGGRKSQRGKDNKEYGIYERYRFHYISNYL